jgi:hypothetical protein
VADAFADDSVWHAEPMYYTAHKEDSLVNRYCALIGMNDPFSYFIGNYNRWSYLSKRFTAYPYETVREDENAVVIDVHPGKVPTFGANGFFTRRAALEGVDWEPYYFDIDVFQQMAGAGRRRIAVLKTGTRHLFCDRIGTFRRKQARRIRDFHYHNRAGSRTYYENGPVSRWRYLWFLLSCVTIIPLLFQTIRGMASKPSSAWFFHTPACLITFWEYSWGTVRSLFKAEEYSRDGWSQ